MNNARTYSGTKCLSNGASFRFSNSAGNPRDTFLFSLSSKCVSDGIRWFGTGRSILDYWECLKSIGNSFGTIKNPCWMVNNTENVRLALRSVSSAPGPNMKVQNIVFFNLHFFNPFFFAPFGRNFSKYYTLVHNSSVPQTNSIFAFSTKTLFFQGIFTKISVISITWFIF